jgi:hypothetical protein
MKIRSHVIFSLLLIIGVFRESGVNFNRNHADILFQSDPHVSVAQGELEATESDEENAEMQLKEAEDEVILLYHILRQISSFKSCLQYFSTHTHCL